MIFWIVLLSTISMIQYCTFPALIRLGGYFYPLMVVLLTLASSLFYYIIFTQAKSYKPYFDQEHFDDLGASWKRAEKIGLWIVIISLMGYQVWTDYFRMPGLYYVGMYIHWWVVYWLFKREVYR